MEHLPKILILAIVLAVQICEGAECENGWAQYKDELCIQAITTDLVTFDEAKQLCSSQGPSACLLMVKEAELQEFLTGYTNELNDNLWLGAKHENNTDQFKWIDGEPLTYTNWAEGYPRNTTDTEACIYVRPANSITASGALWEDSTCQRRNLAICQKTLGWSLQDAVQEIIRIRNELNLTKKELNLTKVELNLTKVELNLTKVELNLTKVELNLTNVELNSKLDAANSEIAEVSSRVIPVGSTYVEYYKQRSPADLWPSLSWQDITSTYAGLFFRAMGAGSEGWGITQSACAPRINQTQGNRGVQYSNPLTIPPDGWSEWGYSGHYYIVTGNLPVSNNIMFHTAGCEVRPRNQAVRIWKRIN